MLAVVFLLSFFTVPSVMHICMQYRETVKTVHCIQLNRRAVDAIGLNPVTTDIDHDCKGHVAVCKWHLHDQEMRSKLQSCSQKGCVACIIINIEDSLDVPSTNAVNFNTYSFFPIYLLKREDGAQLLQMIKKSAGSKINIRTEMAQSNLIFSK